MPFQAPTAIPRMLRVACALHRRRDPEAEPVRQHLPLPDFTHPGFSEINPIQKAVRGSAATALPKAWPGDPCSHRVGLVRSRPRAVYATEGSVFATLFLPGELGLNGQMGDADERRRSRRDDLEGQSVVDPVVVARHVPTR